MSVILSVGQQLLAGRSVASKEVKNMLQDVNIVQLVIELIKAVAVIIPAVLAYKKAK